VLEINLNLPSVYTNEKPLHLIQWVKDFASLCTWKDIENCMNNPDLWGLELIDPKNRKLPYKGVDLSREKDFLFDRFNNGDHGLVITKFGHYNATTRNLLRFFEERFDVNAEIHVYCGLSSQSTSFKIHCDAPTNFIIQVEGTCHWKIYENRMSNLLDFEHSHPDHVYEEDLTTVIDTVLNPGDGVMIPPRQYHVAIPTGRRISLSIPCWGRERGSRTRCDRNYYKFPSEITS